ncbi:hypothetical protein AWH62_08925 [Maricaulis sp. W15]|uniref:Uncharacterized protein n=1 Tax=Maricaulis maris TaxID=74318 RepID=A0A495DMQ0_9PROT|nr:MULTISPECIES: hypothetical protein [Maricaulis]OLF73063.1 hypothetical protein AWH62_08925 [Maricaulis sp. W15]RKR03006.1 hypothetical protein C7435_0951 [Maricaulis maris]
MQTQTTDPARHIWFLRATWPPLVLAVCCALLSLVHAQLWWGLVCLGGASLLCFDSVARHREFRALRHSVRVAKGLTGEALARFRAARSTWCSRRAAIAAAHAEGFGADARALVDGWGYKPWHVFPDRAFTFGSPFFKPAFWQSVLGLRR